MENLSSGTLTLLKNDSVEQNENENNQNELYSHISTIYPSANIFVLPERLDTVRETISEQSLLPMLLKPVHYKTVILNPSEKGQAMTAIKEQNEKSERFKTLISIRNMFKEYEIKIKNEDGTEYEVIFNGFIENDGYEKYFEMNELISIVDEDGEEILDVITDEKCQEIIAECVEYAFNRLDKNIKDEDNDYDGEDDNDYDDYDDYDDEDEDDRW
jgi:hypothetical protein